LAPNSGCSIALRATSLPGPAYPLTKAFKEKPENKDKIEQSVTRFNEKRASRHKNKPNKSKSNLSGSTTTDNSSAKQVTKPGNPTAFAATMIAKSTNYYTAAATKENLDSRLFDLKGMWILDSGADVHIANKSMWNRFTKEKDHFGNGMLQSGNGTLAIECWGSITLNCVGTDKNIWEMKLTNVAYIPDYFTNIVLSQLTRQRQFYLNEEDLALYHNGTPEVYLQSIDKKDVLEAHYTTESGYKN
jgi:hypothetical protein